MGTRTEGPNRQALVLARAGQPYGTPRILDDALISKIVRYVRAGDRPFVAAEICDVPRRTFYAWMEKGEADDLDELATIYRDLVHKIRAGESYAEHVAHLAIRRSFGDRAAAAVGEGELRIPADWRAALAWLSRRRDGWQERKELTGKDGSPLFGSSGFEGATDDEIEERLNGLRNRGGTKRRAARTKASARTRPKAGAAKPS